MLIECSECEGKLSSEALHCPHCGKQMQCRSVVVEDVDMSIGEWATFLLKMTIGAIPSLVALGLMALACLMAYSATQ